MPEYLLIYLLDTNILVRQADVSSPQRALVVSTLKALRASGATLVTTVQTLMEFWVVATRPADKNGLGFAPTDAEKLLQYFEKLYPPLPEAAGLYAEWRRLVTTYGAQGKTAHDARFVAAMKLHDDLTHFLTFNASDFKRYAIGEGISVVDPFGSPDKKS